MTIHISYNQNMQALETLLEDVTQSGDFHAQGNIELPMPRIEVDGPGLLSFPLPNGQIKALIQAAERAPYGRGEQTQVDTDVRRVWQISPQQLRISGRSWAGYLQQILSQVSSGLGFPDDAQIEAELYKMLVYDEGSFFLTHRDSEKSPGMFGTLVLVLPSEHRGGELLIRHAGRQVSVDLSGADVSEIGFVAFYADCEHEIQPVTEGSRVCLIYNLVQATANTALPKAVDHRGAIAGTATLLREAFDRPDSPTKLVWLLEHQYSQAGLAFAGLKGSDAARAQVLLQAAEEADCAAHLAMVHIRETGSAELNYQSDWKYRGRYYHDDLEDADDDDFEIIDIFDDEAYLDHWRDTQDEQPQYGALPLDEDELLPAGALANEPPDEQRVTEATGNEGASFERAYLRAALVLWPRRRYARVLLQRGIDALMPWLNQQVANWSALSAEDQQGLLSLSQELIADWPSCLRNVLGMESRSQTRTQFLLFLSRLDQAAVTQRFIAEVIQNEFNGTETAALIQCCRQLPIDTAQALLQTVVRDHMDHRPRSCINLLDELTTSCAPTPAWRTALTALAETVAHSLNNLPPADRLREQAQDWTLRSSIEDLDAKSLYELLKVLHTLAVPEVLEQASQAMIDNSEVFHPTALLPATLNRLSGEEAIHIDDSAALSKLWRHTVSAVLAECKQAPQAPKDWSQAVELPCPCEDCRTLERFARAPQQRQHRFSVNTDRRRHLHATIEREQLDVSHVTERQSRPYTLVCTKTLTRYAAECEQYQHYQKTLQQLAAMVQTDGSAYRSELDDIQAVLQRQPETCTLG